MTSDILSIIVSWTLTFSVLILTKQVLQHFAPDPCQSGFLRGREAMRLELWPAMLQSAPLLTSMLLVMGTHYKLCVTIDTAGQGLDPLTLRGLAISSIKSDLSVRSGGHLHPYIVGAIALLAGWEFVSGNMDAHIGYAPEGSANEYSANQTIGVW